MADKPAGKPAAAPAGKPGAILVEIFVAVLVFLLIIPFIKLFSGVSSGTFDPVVTLASTIFDFIKLLSTVISMVAIVVVIFSFIRIQEITAEDNKKLGLALSWESEKNQKNIRWQRVEEYMTSLNPSDWKVAILEADNILDEITTRMGYAGTTLGERMKKIPASEFPYLEEAWEAHKIRNAVAHKGTDYALSRSDAEHVINTYYRIFAALGYL
jgi:large-conductance mechanosensitive channel